MAKGNKIQLFLKFPRITKEQTCGYLDFFFVHALCFANFYFFTLICLLLDVTLKCVVYVLIRERKYLKGLVNAYL